MLSKTRPTAPDSPAPGVIPARSNAGDGQPAAARANGASRSPSRAPHTETRGEHARRKAHRSRLHAYAILGVAVVAFLIALAASNTARVNVNWVFGSSHVSLVWLVLFAAIMGWLLGLLVTAAFHWRTRAPRGHGHTS